MRVLSSFFRLAKIAVIAVFGMMVLSGPGAAQESSFFAPKRMALLIGNADYDQNGKIDPVRSQDRMKDLVHPCKDDVRIIKQKLERAGWKADEIETHCDLTGPRLRDEIETFTDDYRRADQGTLAILFFSGHGAQIADQGFIFGVDARIDWASVPTDQYPSASGLLGKAAVSLPRTIFQEVSQYDSRYPPDERSSGFVVLLDACRNNPLLSEGQVKEKVTALRSNNETWSGLLVGFATRHGYYARDDYPKSRASLYTAKLSAFLGQPANVRAVLDRTAAEVLTAAGRMDPSFNQFPDAVGLISVSLCIRRDCPLAWKGEADDEVDAEPVAPVVADAPAATGSNTAVPTSGPVSEGPVDRTGVESLSQPGSILEASIWARRPGGLLWRVSYAPQMAIGEAQIAPGSQAQSLPQSQSQTQRSLKTQFMAQEKTRRIPIVIYDAERDLEAQVPAETFSISMAFDVRVCVDGVNQDVVEARGRALAGQLADKARSENQPGGIKILRVRLLFLSALDNSLAGYRFAEDTVLYDTADDVPLVREWDEVTWARWAVPNLDERFTWAGRQVGQSRNLISFFVCADPAPQSPVTTLYVQTPSDESKPVASAIGTAVVAATASLREADSVEVRPNSPNLTQLRYFHLEDRNAVFNAASFLERVQKLRVSVSYQPWYADRARPGAVELWLGKADQVAWNPDMKIQSDAGEEAPSKSPGGLDR